MSLKDPISVQSTHLSERPEGTRTLAISTKVGVFEFEFTPELWARLAASARWFEEHVTMVQPVTNGEHQR